MRHFSFLFFLRESDDVIVYSAAERVLLPEFSRSTGNGCLHLKSRDGKLPNCGFVTADLSVCRYTDVPRRRTKLTQHGVSANITVIIIRLTHDPATVQYLSVNGLYERTVCDLTVN